MRVLALALLLMGLLASAEAAEPSGCDKFAWDIQAEQRLLASPTSLPSASALQTTLPAAVQLDLTPFDPTKLVMPPERAPKSPTSSAGYVKATISQAGLYKVTLSGEGWIDVIQDGRFLKPEAFSGAVDCPNVRKTVKFRLSAAPISIQISGAPKSNIGIAITAAD